MLPQELVSMASKCCNYQFMQESELSTMAKTGHNRIVKGS